MKNLSSFKILLFTLMSFFIFSCTTENEEQVNEELTSVVNSARVTSGGIYYLKGSNGKYVCHEDARRDMRCNRTNAGEWEQFYVTQASSGYWYLKGVSHNKYVSSEQARRDMRCNRTRVGSWEQFDISYHGTRNGHDLVAFKARTNNKYISSEHGRRDMRCNRSAVGSWEKFELIPVNSSNNNIYDHISRDWKITMPYDSNGRDSGNVSDPDDRNRNAVEYQYDELDDASSDFPRNFYVQNNEVFFVAHAGGATTSGSIYPRTELRGVNPSNGDDGLMKFNSNPSLDVTVRVVELPVQKAEVCMVQLKNSKGKETVRVDFWRGDDDALHVTENDSTPSDQKDVIDYSVGDRLRVRINVNSTQVRLRMNNLDTGDSYDERWNHNDSKGYFKVGSYIQSSITYCEEKNKPSSSCTDDNRNAKAVVAVSNMSVNSGTWE